MDPTEVRSIGPYEVVRFIAEGSFCRVFEVLHPETGKHLALKILKAEARSEASRFRAEAELLGRVNHPNLVELHGLGDEPETGLPYYVMTLADGLTLQQRIWQVNEGQETARGLDVGDVAAIFRGVLAALAQIHQSGAIHRDIKPANILLTSDGTPLLADLGIAKVEGSGATKTGVAMGTALYMSPEQAQGHKATTQSDVFAVGLCMYHALHGFTVYDLLPDVDAQSGAAVLGHLIYLRKHQQAIPFQFAPHIPQALQQMIRRACAFEPERRFRDAGEMLDQLRAITAASSSGTTITFKNEPLTRWRPGRAAWLALAAGVALSAAAVTVYLVGSHRGPGVAQQLDALGDQLSQVEARQAQAKPLNPSPDSMRLVDKELAYARQDLLRSRDDLQRGEEDRIKPRLPDIQRSLASACEELGGVFASAAGDQSQAIEKMSEELVDLGAPQHFAKAWDEFQKAQAAGVHPVEATQPCPKMNGFGDQLKQLAAVRGQGRALGQQLEQMWPQLADKAREEALRARDAAAGARGSHQEADAALKEGAARLDAADGLRVSDPKAAVAAYRDATTRFTAAKQIAAAAAAQRVAQRASRLLGADLRSEAVAELRDLKAADDAFRDGDWDHARELYERARVGLDTVREDAGASRAARVARDKATEMRTAAVDAGAGTDQLAAADQQRSTADTAFGAKHYDDAEAAYSKATLAYEQVRAAAVKKTEGVRTLLLGAQKGLESMAPEGCDKLCKDARGDCQRAHDTLAAARVDLDAGRVSDARDSIDHANAVIARTQRIEDICTLTEPRPPVIASRTPEAEVVQVRSGDAVKLQVSASDPNNDALRYRWTVGGVPQKEEGPQLELHPQVDAVVEVAVSDVPAQGPSQQVTARWKLSVSRNRPPTVAFSGAPSSTEVGRSVRLRVRTNDPDGDATQVEFLVNGKEVAQGTSFSFRPDRVGTYEIAAVARDGRGGEARAVQQLAVREPAPAAPRNRPPSLKVTPSGEVTLHVGDTRVFRATARDPDGDSVMVQSYLDGRLVASGPKFSYRPTAPGKHTLEVRATDQKATSKVRVALRVEGRSPSVAQSPDAQFSQVAQQLATAMGSCDLQGVASLVGMDDIIAALFIKQLVKKCELCGGFEAQSKLRAPLIDGDSAQVIFQQTYQCTNGSKPASLSLWRATFQRQPSGSWVLSSMSPTLK